LADFGPFSRRVVRLAAVSLSRAQRYVRRIGPASPITPSVEDFTEHIYNESVSLFFSIGPICWESFKLEYLNNLSSEFREIFWDCCPRRAGPYDVFTYPVPQLGEGLGAPKFGVTPQKSPTSGIPGSNFSPP